MKISIIGTVGLPANYGGFETLTENLIGYLKDRYQFVVYCSSRNRKDRPESYKNAKLVYIPLNANGVQSIFYDIISIFRASLSSDTLLILGVSGCICLPFINFFSKVNIIINIDGLEWKRDKWGGGAKRFLKLSESLAVKYADIIITDNLAINKYVKAEYGKNSVLIAYGGDHVLPENIDVNETWPISFPQNSYAIKVCRIEPENNIEIVLSAFSKTINLPLVVVGNWSNSEFGKVLKDKYKENKNIELLDPIYDINKLHLLRSNAALYIHGHSAGGTNPSLVEAMYLGLPIFSFDVQYNRGTTQNSAIYFESEADLTGLLENIDSLNLDDLGKKMKDIALKNYTWKIIAEKYAQLFDDASITR